LAGKVDYLQLPKDSSMVEIIWEVSGMKFTVKRTGFCHSVLYDL
jgi:hypothetical protein